MFVNFLSRVALTLAIFGALSGSALAGRVGPLAVAVAAAARDDAQLAGYYRSVGYAPLWVGTKAAQSARRQALLRAVGRAGLHGLPPDRYDVDRLRDLMADARTIRQRGTLDVELSRFLLRFAADLRHGILDPRAVVPAIKRDAASLDGPDLLREFEHSSPIAFLNGLAPRSREYARLLREKLSIEDAIRLGSWGAPVAAAHLEEGGAGADVVALRDRLAAMGYLARFSGRSFDASMRKAVQAFQKDHGLTVDGVAGGRTIGELNVGPDCRLGQILVAMERERWMDADRAGTYIWVNLPDYHARIVREGEVVFETRSVIGTSGDGRQTPEFSDRMERMVINPSWHVPRSIVVEEYLPDLRANPYAHANLQIVDRAGRVVSRERGFSQYGARNFPYAMRQPPGPDNALGRVKLLFPNRYHVYLHDTLARHLFDLPRRAFSHGCIRLDDPYGFAFALLAMQSHDPEGEFQRRLATGREDRVELARSLPVHIVYRTAIAKPRGGMEYRDDVYGRDGRILNALLAEGVRLPGLDRWLASSEIGR